MDKYQHLRDQKIATTSIALGKARRYIAVGVWPVDGNIELNFKTIDSEGQVLADSSVMFPEYGIEAVIGVLQDWVRSYGKKPPENPILLAIQSQQQKSGNKGMITAEELRKIPREKSDAADEFLKKIEPELIRCRKSGIDQYNTTGFPYEIWDLLIDTLQARGFKCKADMFGGSVPEIKISW